MLFAVSVCLVIASGLIHAVWNLFAKQSLNKTVFLWSIQWVAVLVYLPLAISAARHLHTSGRGYVLLALTALVHGMYVLFLSRTYTLGDLSVVYPLMRGISPLLVPVIGVLCMGEHLPPAGWVGVTCIVIGIWSLGGRIIHFRSRAKRTEAVAIRWALAVGLAIMGYTSLDKLTLEFIPAAIVNEAGNLGNLVALTYASIRSGAIRPEWRANWRTIVLGGILAPGAYLLFLLALRLAPMAQLAPMREVGTVFGTILGITVLKEPQGIRRIAASALIFCGVFVLGVAG